MPTCGCDCSDSLVYVWQFVCSSVLFGSVYHANDVSLIHVLLQILQSTTWFKCTTSLCTDYWNMLESVQHSGDRIVVYVYSGSLISECWLHRCNNISYYVCLVSLWSYHWVHVILMSINSNGLLFCVNTAVLGWYEEEPWGTTERSPSPNHCPIIKLAKDGSQCIDLSVEKWPMLCGCLQ